MRAEVQLILADIGLDSSSFHLMVKGENMVLQWPCTQTTGNFADVVYMLLLVIFTKRQCTIGLCATLVCAVIGPCQPQRRAGYNIEKAEAKLYV